MDIIVGNVAANGASVFLGNGDGTFRSEVDYLTNQGNGAMAIGDVNGDANPDLVLTSWISLTATVLLGNGDGTFSPRAMLPPPPPTLTIFSPYPLNWFGVNGLIADFNGDGKLDILAVENNSSVYGQGEFAVYPGNGDGTFGPPVTRNLYSNGIIAAADFNGDGKLDLAFPTTFGVVISLGNGDGTFGSSNSVLSNYLTVRGIVAGDFNNDGKADLVVLANASNANPPIFVLLGNGDGTFRTLPLGSNGSQIPLCVVAADFNHDGKLDLAVGWDTLSNNLMVMLGNGDGTFQSAASYTTDNLPDGLAVADLNGDGIPDLMAATTNTVNIFLGNGDGTFRGPVYYKGGSFPGSVVTGDFNGDGKLDIAVGDALYLSILPGNGDGTFQTPFSVYGGGAYSPMQTADFNQDDVSDLVVRGGTLFLSRPVVSMFPGGLSFGSQSVGTQSAPSTLALTNVGMGPLSLTNLVTTSGFQATSNCDSKVVRGGECTIEVTFAPTTPGPTQGTLTLMDNTIAGSQSIPLSGIATAPSESLSTSSLAFASQLVSTTSSAQTVTLTNSGNGALSISSIAMSGDFAQTNTCGASVAAGSNCMISVTFKPTVVGTRSGTLAITDNAPGSPHTVNLTGAGQDFTLGVSSGSSSTDTVTAGQAATYSLSVSGLGGMSQAVSFSCTGAPSAATCTVNPASVTPSGSGSVSTIVTVTTMARSSAPPKLWRVPPFGLDVETITLSLLVLLMVVARTMIQLAARRQRTCALRLGMVSAAVMALLLTMAACGGGGGEGGGGGGGSTNPGTPAGTYTLTVTGTVSGSGTLQHSTTLTLTVN
jgi:hypothetical protein